MFILPKELLNKFLEKYGEDEQLQQAMGECGELIAACQNYHRAKMYGYKSTSKSDLLREAVDVYFMIQQIRNMDPDLFDLLCQSKLKKVINKFKNEG